MNRLSILKIFTTTVLLHFIFPIVLAQKAEKILEVKYERYANLDRSIFDEINKNQSFEWRKFNWERMNEKQKFTLWVNGNESLYESNPGLNSEKKFKDKGGTATYNTNKMFLYRSLKEQYTLLNINKRDFIIKDPIKNYSWQTVDNETQEILGYLCKKAIGKDTENNATLVAWYAPKIKSQQGPYYYSGLPGLILQVEVFPNYSAEMKKTSTVVSIITKATKIDQVKVKKLQLKTDGKKIMTMQEWKQQNEEFMKKQAEMNSSGVDTSD